MSPVAVINGCLPDYQIMITTDSPCISMDRVGYMTGPFISSLMMVSIWAGRVFVYTVQAAQGGLERRATQDPSGQARISQDESGLIRTN